MKRSLTVLLIICLLYFVPLNSLGTTLIIYPVEEVIKQSDLIVEARVVNIENFPIARSSLGYSLITLEINDYLKGKSENRITMKRFGIDETGKQLFGEYKPIFRDGDRVIVSLIKNDDGHYLHLGLYRGTFHVQNNRVTDYDMDVDEFKELITNVVNGTLVTFPKAKTDPYNSLRFKKHSNTDSYTLLSGHGSHLNGHFVAFNETWDLSFLPIQFQYNPDGAPEATGTVLNRINEAFVVWNDLTLCELEFQTITTSHLTSARQVDNDESVIFWQNWTQGVLAQEFPFPEEQGVGTKVGSDILFNTDFNNQWFFGSTPPSTRNLQEIDFSDVLIHELGHTQGLDHTNISETIMYGGGYVNIAM